MCMGIDRIEDFLDIEEEKEEECKTSSPREIGGKSENGYEVELSKTGDGESESIG